MPRVPRRLGRVLAPLLAGTLAACFAPVPLEAPQALETVPAEVGFDAARNVVYTGYPNRVSRRSAAGGVHADDHGLRLDPRVTRDADSRALLAIELLLVHELGYDATAGAPGVLGAPQQLVFLLDGWRRLELAVVDGESDWAPPGAAPPRTIRESGRVPLSAEQYRELTAARTLAVTVQGTRQALLVAPADVAPAFQVNLRRFYEQYAQ